MSLTTVDYGKMERDTNADYVVKHPTKLQSHLFFNL